jgi:hypothetical protein
MSDQLFQIIFRGKLLSGFTMEQARANLAQLFRTDETRIDTMLAQPKWVIKAGVAKETAQKIQEAMRNAGLMVAIMADESASALANAAAAPTNAATSAVAPTPATTPTPAIAAPPAQAATVKISPVTPVDAVIDTPSADAPLAVKPKVAAFEPDLSSFSLADVGAVMDASGPKKAERSFALEQFSLANVGAQLIEKKPVIAKAIDTDGLSLVAADIPKEPKLTALHREFEG